MNSEQAGAIKHTMTSITIIVLVVVGGVILGGWWLQQNFGPIATISIVGGVFAAGFMALGILLNQRNTRHTMETLVAHHESIAQTRRADAGVERERVRFEREQFGHYARMTTMDVQDSRRLARQQAGLLVDLERQRWEQEQAQQAPAPAWAMDDDDDGAGVRYYE